MRPEFPHLVTFTFTLSKTDPPRTHLFTLVRVFILTHIATDSRTHDAHLPMIRELTMPHRLTLTPLLILIPLPILAHLLTSDKARSSKLTYSSY